MAKLDCFIQISSRVFNARLLRLCATDLIPEAAGKAVYVFFQSRCRHIKLRATNALIGGDKPQFLEALQRSAHRAVGATGNLDNVSC